MVCVIIIFWFHTNNPKILVLIFHIDGNENGLNAARFRIKKQDIRTKGLVKVH